MTGYDGVSFEREGGRELAMETRFGAGFLLERLDLIRERDESVL